MAMGASVLCSGIWIYLAGSMHKMYPKYGVHDVLHDQERGDVPRKAAIAVDLKEFWLG